MMGSMTADETYNGYANRETWAFNLHWQNDEGMYRQTLEAASEGFGLSITEGDREVSEISDFELGDRCVEYWAEVIASWDDDPSLTMPESLRTFRDEVGSWWRVDRREVGAAVRESLGVEGGDDN